MKKIFSICFLMILTLFSFSFVGCKENYTKDNVNSMYKEVLSYVGDSEGFLNVGVDEAKVKQEATIQEDKAYIFPLCYDNFVLASGGLFFGVASRLEMDITYTLRTFSQDEVNLVYGKIKAVRDSSIEVARNRSIFESSGGNLMYRELVVACNDLIEKLNDLNNTFSPMYFSHYFTGYTEGELSSGELKDVLFYGLQSVSFVTYNYELKNFEFSNPYGEVKTWYDGTILLKEENESIQELSSKIRKEDLTNGMTIETKNQVISIIERIQNEREGYADEYTTYQKALDNVDIVEYIKASNKTAYVQSLSEREKACFEVMDRFINGRYKGFSFALNSIVTNYL